LRLYETLCLGRIPLFINTDCVLPFENNIDWKELCLWVDENDLDRIGEIVLDFHSSISKEEFKDKQLYAREVWEKYLSKEGFTNGLYLLLKNRYLAMDK
jgi:Exostosin family.